MSYPIRRATKEDLPSIIKIYNHAIPLMVNDDTAPLEVNDREEWFQQFSDDHPLWVMTDQGQVIAWCALEEFYPHQAYHHSAEIAIYVHPDYQGQHLGSQLLQFADQQIKTSLKIKTVIAYIYAENLPSQKLFKKLGFSDWGELKHIAEINGQLRTLKIYGKNY